MQNNSEDSSTFVDSIHEYDSVDEHGSFKRSIPEEMLEMLIGAKVSDPADTASLVSDDASESDIKAVRFIREATKEEKEGNSGATGANKTNQTTVDCDPRYIGHELDPVIARALRTLCLTVILLRAGLEMDPVALWKLSGQPPNKRIKRNKE